MFNHTNRLNTLDAALTDLDDSIANNKWKTVQRFDRLEGHSKRLSNTTTSLSNASKHLFNVIEELTSKVDFLQGEILNQNVEIARLKEATTTHIHTPEDIDGTDKH